MTLDKKVDLNELIDIVGGRLNLHQKDSFNNWRDYATDIEAELNKKRDIVIFYAERLKNGTYSAELLITRNDFERIK